MDHGTTYVTDHQGTERVTLALYVAAEYWTYVAGESRSRRS
jgi:hypothetical protein